MRTPSRIPALCVGAIALTFGLCAGPALAQKRIEENATTQSSDAFGRSVGNERTGLYGSEDVRGFSPVDAGNVRIQGLTIDLIDRLSNRLVEGNTIRVGLAAQRYPFPAPTGLVDFRLMVPEDELAISLDIDNGQSFGIHGFGGNVVAKVPLDGARLGFAGGVGFRNVEKAEGGINKFFNESALLAWRPGKAEILLFTSGIMSRRDVARPTYFPVNSAPPQIKRGLYTGLDWATRRNDGFTHGVIAKLPLASGWRIDAGLFLSTRRNPTIFNDLLQGVEADGRIAKRTVIADGNNFDRSLSGEVRISHDWKVGAFSHTLTLGLRGRQKDRRFGGSVSLPISRLTPGEQATIYQVGGWSQPAYSLAVDDLDHVRQLTGGIAYNLLWNNTVSLDIGVAKSSYRKAVDYANPATPDTVTKDRPLLWNVAGSLAIAKNIILFGGIIRGQEEALIAPETASNRGEAPSAIRTSQEELGLRFGLGKNLSLVASAFQISKPYFNLDTTGRYRNLGTLTNRGLEFSLTGKLSNSLTIVAGTMLLDPKISGEAITSGKYKPRPVGQIRRRSQLNLDWRPQGGKSAFSFDLALESLSARMANATNTLQAPARVTFNLGARYRFDLGKIKAVIRPSVINVTNNYGWNVTPSGGWTYIPARVLNLALMLDL